MCPWPEAAPSDFEIALNVLADGISSIGYIGIDHGGSGHDFGLATISAWSGSPLFGSRAPRPRVASRRHAAIDGSRRLSIRGA